MFDSVKNRCLILLTLVSVWLPLLTGWRSQPLQSVSTPTRCVECIDCTSTDTHAHIRCCMTSPTREFSKRRRCRMQNVKHILKCPSTDETPADHLSWAPYPSCLLWLFGRRLVVMVRIGVGGWNEDVDMVHVQAVGSGQWVRLNVDQCHDPFEHSP